VKKHLIEPAENNAISRKKFLVLSARYGAAVAGIVAGISIIRIIVPKRKAANRLIAAGHYADFPFNDFTLLKEHGLFIFRDHEGLRAVSAVCTHLGCIIEKSVAGFICPCHGSTYNKNGSVLSGAASHDLHWYAMEKGEDGQVYVNISDIVGPENKLKI
jgi:cytochrome b6-f complex iron-sulfur subunit